MKKVNVSKKLGLFALSVVTAAAIGISAVSAKPASVNAAYSYTETAKSDEYIASLFGVKSDKITVTAGFTVEDEFKTESGTKRSGVLLTFANGAAADADYVEITKSYKAADLQKAVTMLPLIEEDAQLAQSASLANINIEIVEKVGEAVKASVQIRMGANGSWNATNFSMSAAAAVKNDAPTVNQTLAGYNLSSHDRLNGSPYKGVKYLRKPDNGFYTSAGMTGGRESLKAKDITYGYVQSAGVVQVITNRSGNGGLGCESVPGFSVIRDLNFDTNAGFIGQPGADNDFANALGSEQVFNGFSANADLYVRISATSKKAGARLLISDIAGEDLSSPIKADGAAYKAVVNKPYKLPKVKSYVNSVDGEAFTGTYDVTPPEGSARNITDAAYTGDDTLTPDVPGRYKVTYKMEVSGNKYEGFYYFDALESATLKFTQTPAAPTAFNTVRGSTYDLGAVATSTIYDEGADNTKVGVVVLYYGTSYDNEPTLETSIDDVGASYEYVFANAGKYRIVYGAYDDAGNELFYGDKEYAPNSSKPDEKIACVEIEIKNLYSSLTIEAENDWAFGVQTETVKINRDIVKFYDNHFGRNFWGVPGANESCVMKVKVPGAADFRNFTDGELINGYEFNNVFGLYEFTYNLTYVNDSVNYAFKVNVIDDQAPEIYLIDSEYVYGAVGKVSGDGKNFVYNVTAGSQIKFGGLRAEDKIGVKSDYTEDIKLVKILNGVSTDLTTEYQNNRNAFSVTLLSADNGAIYKFSVQEIDGNGTDTLSFIFRVQESFITIGFDKTFNASYGTDDTVKFDGFNVYNEKSEPVSATKQITVLRTGDDEPTVIANGTGDYKFVLSGEYVITFKAEFNGARAEKSYTVSVKDKTAPEITVKGNVVKKGVKGESVSVPEFSGSDLESSANTTIKVTNALGEEINVYEGKFIPSEAGTYTVSITSVDDAGNVNVYSYNVEIAEAAIKSFPIFRVLGFTVGGLLIAAAAVFFLLTFAGKKKSAVKSDDELND